MVIFLMKISNLEKEQKNLSRNTLEFHKIIVIFVYLHFTGFFFNFSYRCPKKFTFCRLKSIVQ